MEDKNDINKAFDDVEALRAKNAERGICDDGLELVTDSGPGDTPIMLADRDSCIVFRDDIEGEGGTNIELYIPSMEDEEAIAPDSAIVASVIASRMNDPEFIAELYEWFNDKGEINDKG